ncbi:MAG: FAD-dependent oxidoreductase [Desulfosalsimonas sp.]
MYRHLFSKGYIGDLALGNRVIMAPMATNFASAYGEVTQKQIDYYVERAKSGIGLIFVENANVDYPRGRNGATQLRIDDDLFLPGLSYLVETIKEAAPESKVALQLNHAGAATSSARTGGIRPGGPSDIPTSPHGEAPQPLSKEEIADIVEKFGQAALRAQKAGFDLVELHGGFAYLLAQFISPLTNKRTDEFGGSLENRMRFPLRVVEKIKSLSGKGYPLSFRINGDEFVKGGVSLSEAKQVSGLLEKAGADLIHVTAGSGFTPEKHIEPSGYKEGWKVYLAGEIKKVVDVPVAAVGVIRDPQNADEIISAGKADFVVIGRGILADPYWAKKARQGKAREIRPCILCNCCASRRIFEAKAIRCSVNPMMGYEKEFSQALSSSLQKPKKIIVIGGGPAGMQNSIILHEMGHEVILFEANKELGGQLLLARVPPHKEKIGDFKDYLVMEVLKRDIEVNLNTTVTTSIVEECSPDVIVVATGAAPFILPFDIESDVQVLSAFECLQGTQEINGDRVAVIGGGLVGCETSEYLAGLGYKVSIIDMLPQIANDMNIISRNDLFRRLEDYNVEVITGHEVDKISKGCVTCKSLCQGEHTEVEITADAVIYALGNRSNNELYDEIKKTVNIPVYNIGDSRTPGMILDAMRDAVVTAYKI